MLILKFTLNCKSNSFCIVSRKFLISFSGGNFRFFSRNFASICFAKNAKFSRNRKYENAKFCEENNEKISREIQNFKDKCKISAKKLWKFIKKDKILWLIFKEGFISEPNLWINTKYRYSYKRLGDIRHFEKFRIPRKYFLISLFRDIFATFLSQNFASFSLYWFLQKFSHFSAKRFVRWKP